MKKTAPAFLLFLLVALTGSSAFALEDYPPTPDSKLTPGSLCKDPDALRYPEKIPYCERNVNVPKKLEVFKGYMDIGFQINLKNRARYKIDHLIPLCAGGSNEIENLWPEFETVYTILDPIEPAICQKMQDGRLKQKHAVEIVLRAKHNPAEAQKLIEYVESL